MKALRVYEQSQDEDQEDSSRVYVDTSTFVKQAAWKANYN